MTLACIGAYAALGAASADAQATLPGGATINFRRLLVHEDLSKDELIEPAGDLLFRAFNLARCQCSEVSATNSDFTYELSLARRMSELHRPGELWTGPGCDKATPADRMMVCSMVGTIADLDVLAGTPAQPRVSVFKLAQPTGTGCGPRESDGTLWVGADGDANGDLEYWASKQIRVDTQAPPAVQNLKATAGEGAINLSWEFPMERNTDVAYVQVLCARAGDAAPALAKAAAESRFDTGKTLCNIDKPLTVVASDGTSTPPTWATEASERYICGESTKVDRLRVGGLTNGVAYQVTVLTVDVAGNATGVYAVDPVTPVPVRDFWEVLQEGGSVDGGFCLLARTYGDDSDLTRGLRAFRDDTLRATALGRALIEGYYEVSAKLAPLVDGWLGRAIAAVVLAPLVALALAWHALGLPLCALLLFGAAWAWRRRRALAASLRARPGLRRAGPAIAGAMLTLGVLGHASVSHAQAELSPYWDDLDDSPSEESDQLRWHAGLRVGLYRPDIDDQAGTSPGPYQQVFGKGVVMPMLDVDRVLWEGVGQFAVGGTIGFFTKKAKALPTDDGDPETPLPMVTDTTAFRMIPLQATAAFRLTYFDTRYHVPIVPYVRAGLAYYIWWVERPDGGVAKVFRGGEEQLGRGASLGVVGSLGLAVRAERIDPQAASALRQSGLQHAGFYGELQAAKVNDFGIGNKLSVGGVAFFGGVDFEY
ncbi:MAG: MXAN_2562 family outer membrane beta-barrel protein [Kofleriaceae bacterium]